MTDHHDGSRTPASGPEVALDSPLTHALYEELDGLNETLTKLRKELDQMRIQREWDRLDVDRANRRAAAYAAALRSAREGANAMRFWCNPNNFGQRCADHMMGYLADPKVE